MEMKIITDQQIPDFIQRFEERRGGVVEEVEKTVKEIIDNIKKEQDCALFHYAKALDGTDLKQHPIQVSRDELESAYLSVESSLRHVLLDARDNIRKFHEKGLSRSWLSWEEDGVLLGQRMIPLHRVGVYVPGGRAAYPSSLLMGVIPAQVAGVKEIAVVTPSDSQGHINPVILATAHLLNIDKVYRIGGAHAIAALALGTQSIPRVDKIVGPGNIYVATAKKMLYGSVGIDMVAGPSEVVIIADHQAEADFVAADLLAQAEHDPLASSILITDNPDLAKQVSKAVSRQFDSLRRQSILENSLGEYGAIILADSLNACVELCNQLAPEHLGLHVEDPWQLSGQIQNAGAIFLGSYSPESVGDYWAGPNHVLPTNGSARFFSPLNANDFLKMSSLVSYSKIALSRYGQKIIDLANSEGLDAHANAIKIRI